VVGYREILRVDIVETGANFSAVVFVRTDSAALQLVA